MSIWREILGLPVKPAGLQRRNAYGYSAAQVGRLFADFSASKGSADSELKYTLETMRERCRDLARNDPYVKRYLRLRQNNIVGKDGFSHQVKALNDFTGELDSVGNQLVEDSWKVFTRKGNCTPDGRQSFTDLCKAVDSAVCRDGEAFIQIVKGQTFPHRIAFHHFEADRIDHKKNERLKNGNEIRMGVEINRYDRPVAYWIQDEHPGDTDFATINKRASRRVPADQIIHVFEQLRPGQTRGEPPLAPVVAQIKMLNAHREAELVAARLSASKMGFFTSDSGDEVPADDYENGSGTVPIIDAEPGTFHQLPRGVDFTPFDMNHPSTAFEDFQKGILRGIASAMGVSYASLANDLTQTSYSSIRQGALEERDSYAGMQQFLIEHFVLPVYSAWLASVMEFGIINLPIRQFDKFYGATTFRGRGWQWVDPQKEISAAVEAMHNGIMSPQDVSNHYGRDFQETQKEWQSAQQIAEAYGQELAFGPFGANKANKPILMEPDDGEL